MKDKETSPAPGYKQPWLWFILTPIIAVFFMGMTMLYIATTSHDGVVVDNFYKDGLSINVRKEQDLFAIEHQLKAQITLQQRQIRLKLEGNLEPLPQQLHLQIIYPTQDDFDHEVILTRAGDLYLSALPENLKGRRQLQLHPLNTDLMWRLHGEEVFPVTGPISLSPKQP